MSIMGKAMIEVRVMIVEKPGSLRECTIVREGMIMGITTIVEGGISVGKPRGKVTIMGKSHDREKVTLRGQRHDWKR